MPLVLNLLLAAALPIAIVAWGVVRLRRTRRTVCASLERDGYHIVRIERRVLRQGPLFWTSTPSQVVYRLTVLDTSGRQRTGWARWGRRWLPNPDALKLWWDQ